MQVVTHISYKVQLISVVHLALHVRCWFLCWVPTLPDRFLKFPELGIFLSLAHFLTLSNAIKIFILLLIWGMFFSFELICSLQYNVVKESWNIVMFDLPPDKTAAKNLRLPLLSPLLAHVVHPANVQNVQNIQIL